jgi:hypothetical protein
VNCYNIFSHPIGHPLAKWVIGGGLIAGISLIVGGALDGRQFWLCIVGSPITLVSLGALAVKIDYHLRNNRILQHNTQGAAYIPRDGYIVV